jgi:hypothetical protein
MLTLIHPLPSTVMVASMFTIADLTLQQQMKTTTMDQPP